MFIGKAISNFSIPCKWQQSNDTKNCMGNKNFKSIRGPKIYLKTEDMLYSGCNGTGLSFYIKYADESTDEEPVVIAKGVDENGNDFEQRIFINKISLHIEWLLKPHKYSVFKAVKSGKKQRNVGNSYFIPAPLLYRYSYILSNCDFTFLHHYNILFYFFYFRFQPIKLSLGINLFRNI